MEWLESWFPAVSALAGAYLIGSVPFGYLLVNWIRGVDIRSRGSGNIGATNVMRHLGTTAGIATLVLDAGKGALAVWLAGWIGLDRNWVAASGILAVAGHSYPIYLRFRGGKGVATGCGVFLMLAPMATLATAVLFLLTVIVSRFVSLGSVVAALGLPIFIIWWYGPAEFSAALLVSALVLLRHRENLHNLWSRKERPIGAVEEEDILNPGEESTK